MRSLLIAIVVLVVSVYYFESNYRPSVPLYIEIHWMAPFFSGGGYGSEAIATVTAIHDEMIKDQDLITLRISHHGDSVNQRFKSGLPLETASLLRNLSLASSPPAKQNFKISVCHSEPGAWHPANYNTRQCPPADFFASPAPNTTYYTIGRTMFETDRLPSGWDERCNKMNEIWVPADFHMEIFRKGGVEERKLVKIPEPVDIDEFNRKKTTPLELLEFVSMEFGTKPQNSSTAFRFLSVFKWETRKGWDILIESFIKEFMGTNSSTDVSLYLLTQPYHSEPNYIKHIQKFISESLPELGNDLEQFPHVAFIQYPLPQSLLPRLYKSMDAFVLPSRGEGWGRPHIEAMSMGLPAIATNWSGNLEFMKPWNSYLIEVESMVEITTGAFAGHFWANPSISHLRSIMRHVYQNPGEAKTIGRLGENYVRTLYSPSRVASLIESRIKEIINIHQNRTLPSSRSSIPRIP